MNKIKYFNIKKLIYVIKELMIMFNLTLIQMYSLYVFNNSNFLILIIKINI
jgi:hypothetical protein